MRNEDVTVMIVEDEVLIGMMLVKKLRSYGYSVSNVITTGEDAVKTAGEIHPSVILMDVTLAGEMSGIEAARQIKDRYGFPIIIFTGYSDSLLHDQARRIDPVAILTKMAPLSDIIAAIEKAVN